MTAGSTLVPLRWDSTHLRPVRPLPAWEGGARRVTILHTNDFHSHVDGRVGPDGQLRGGLARITATIRRAQAGGPTLVVDAGDMVFGSGTWWDAGGAAAVAGLRARAGYQLAAIGNHDLEHGLEGLREMLAAGHDFVAANLTLSDAQVSARVHPAAIASFNGFRVGLTGITTEETLTLVPRARLTGIGILPPLASVGAVVRELAPLVDAVVIISHLGLDRGRPGDRELAQGLAGGKVAAVVGGHTHAAHDPALLVGGALLCNAGAFGANVGELTLQRAEDGTVQAAERLIPQMPSSLEDPALLAARNAAVEDLALLQREYRVLPRLPELPRPDYELTLLACTLPWPELATPARLMLPRMYVAAARPQRRWASRAELYT
ncbi:MAG: metallophosphoesterase, partial [Chloroflexota bacterium]